MDLSFTAEEERFRKDVRAYLDDLLHGDFAVIRGRGGPGDEHSFFDERLAWERRLGADGWTCVGWPTEFGGRGLPLDMQVIFYEEYARAGGPGRLGHIGEGLIGPTLIHFGTPEQQAEFLPKIRLGQELWCQGYSEPNAGSDLANVQTRAVRDGDRWLISGQKVWTSNAHWSDWCFVLARTDRDAPKHKGISFLLVPMDAPRYRDPPDRADHRDVGVQRGVLRRDTDSRRPRRRRRRERMARRDGSVGVRARCVDSRPAVRLRAGVRRDARRSLGATAGSREPLSSASESRRSGHGSRSSAGTACEC